MRRNEVTYSCHLIKEDGTTVNFEDLPPDEKQALSRKFGQRMANSMSEFLALHPEEYAKLKSIS